MDLTTWHDNVSMPQTDEWLAALRGDDPAEPLGAATPPAREAAPPGPPAVPARAVVPERARDWGQATDAPWASAPAPAMAPGPAPAGAGSRATGFPAPAQAAAPVTGGPAPAAAEVPVSSGPAATAATATAQAARAAIGDELRKPIMWCEMASCISYHADPAALGEADARNRAVRAGWRIDAFGRLVCPPCQQTTSFWTARPVVPWDRTTALVMATLAAVRAGRTAGGPARQQAWHHERPRVRGGRHARATSAPA